MDILIRECQYIGPEQKEYPFQYCGSKVIEGKHYCHDHYYKVYQKGTAVAGRKREKAIEAEIAALKAAQEADDE